MQMKSTGKSFTVINIPIKSKYCLTIPKLYYSICHCNIPTLHSVSSPTSFKSTEPNYIKLANTTLFTLFNNCFHSEQAFGEAATLIYVAGKILNV